MTTPAMVPCPDCGTPARATGQSFCDSCGAFLRWSAPAAPPSNAPAPEAAADTAPEAVTTPIPAVANPAEGAGAADRAGAAGATAPAAPAGSTAGGSAGDTTPLPEVTPGARPDARTEARPVVRPEVRPEVHPDAAATEPVTPHPETRAPSVSDAARALLVPVQEPTARAPEAPGTVLPGRPEAARPKVRAATPAPAPENGTPCPACGTPNHQHRSFCRSCATPLTPRREDNATGPYAGQRPPLHRDRKRWIARALTAAAVVALVVGGVFGGPPAARAVQDHFAKRVAVHPATWTASHWDPKHGPELAGDSYSNTWWGTGYAGDAQGTYLEATFGQPTDLLALLITPGTSKRQGQQSEQARPQEFDLLVTDTSGKAHVSHRSLNDGGVQRIDVRVRDAASVRLTLRSAFGAAKDKQVAIAEVEFFARSKN
ncbi:NADase-type glycan-binding domain-containing protein [Streptomyces hundungensis]|uniref:NADase-type glycan-binding domain-containing protein n=1 Tax=Streptomyces hundungensis TaxID=1077946 RepID=UPI0033FF2EF3